MNDLGYSQGNNGRDAEEDYEDASNGFPLFIAIIVLSLLMQIGFGIAIGYLIWG